MEKKELINKIKNETSLVEFYKLKVEILQHLEGNTDKKKGRGD
jgi:hypothetical protein